MERGNRLELLEDWIHSVSDLNDFVELLCGEL